MQIKLINEQEEKLEVQHKAERDGRVRDRIKAVLLYVEGWSQVDIAQALRIRSEIFHDHLKDFEDSQKFKPENGGSESHLNWEQTAAIVEHLEQKIYMKVSDICAYVQETWDVKFTVSGMTNGFIVKGFTTRCQKECLQKLILNNKLTSFSIMRI